MIRATNIGWNIPARRMVLRRSPLPDQYARFRTFLRQPPMACPCSNTSADRIRKAECRRPSRFRTLLRIPMRRSRKSRRPRVNPRANILRCNHRYRLCFHHRRILRRPRRRRCRTWNRRLAIQAQDNLRNNRCVPMCGTILRLRIPHPIHTLVRALGRRNRIVRHRIVRLHQQRRCRTCRRLHSRIARRSTNTRCCTWPLGRCVRCPNRILLRQMNLFPSNGTWRRTACVHSRNMPRPWFPQRHCRNSP